MWNQLIYSISVQMNWNSLNVIKLYMYFPLLIKHKIILHLKNILLIQSYAKHAELETRKLETIFSSLRITWSLGRAVVCYKAYTLFYFSKWLFVSLDKTRIHRLVSFIALWSCTETVFLTFNRLEPIELTNYIDTNPAMFSSKPSFLFDWRKKYINILDDMGVSELSGHLNLKVN